MVKRTMGNNNENKNNIQKKTIAWTTDHGPWTARENYKTKQISHREKTKEKEQTFICSKNEKNIMINQIGKHIGVFEEIYLFKRG